MQIDTRDLPLVADTGPSEVITERKPIAVLPDQTAFSRWLDLFRWLAALSVVFSHCENRLLIPITDLPEAQRTLPFYVFSFVAGFSHQAVMIFFVLSGYLVGGGLWREAKRNQAIDLPKYFVKRVSRLCIVLYPTFLLIGILNIVGIVAFRGITTGVYPNDIFHSMRPAALACNATFLNTALCDNYGGDGALWSLYNEFWYYLVWPLLLLGFSVASVWKRASFLTLAGLMLTGLTLLQFDSWAIGPYMLIWLLGVVVAWIPRPVIRARGWSTVLFIAGLLAVRLCVRRSFPDAHPVGMFIVDVLIGCLFANLLISMKHRFSLRPPPFRDWNHAIAAFSFSLYCTHTPILNLYGAALDYYTGRGWKMVPNHFWNWCIVFGAIGLSCSVAFLFSLVTEAHTAGLRTWLMGLLRLNTKGRCPSICFD